MNSESQKFITDFIAKHPAVSNGFFSFNGREVIEEVTSICKGNSISIDWDENLIEVFKLIACNFVLNELHSEKRFKEEVIVKNSNGWYCYSYTQSAKSKFGTGFNIEKKIKKFVQEVGIEKDFLGVFSPWNTASYLDDVFLIYKYFVKNNNSKIKKLYHNFFGHRAPITEGRFNFDHKVTIREYYFCVMFLAIAIRSNKMEEYLNSVSDYSLDSICKFITGIGSIERVYELLLGEGCQGFKEGSYRDKLCYVCLNLKRVFDFRQAQSLARVDRDELLKLFKVIYENPNVLQSIDGSEVLVQIYNSKDFDSPTLNKILREKLKNEVCYQDMLKCTTNNKAERTFRCGVEQEYIQESLIYQVIKELYQRDANRQEEKTDAIYKVTFLKKDILFAPLLSYIYRASLALEDVDTIADNILYNIDRFYDSNDLLSYAYSTDYLRKLFDFGFLPRNIDNFYNFMLVVNTCNNFFGLNMFRLPSAVTDTRRYVYRWSPVYGHINESWVGQQNKGASNFFNKLRTRAEGKPIHIYAYAFINAVGFYFVDESTGGRFGQIYKEYFNLLKDTAFLTSSQLEEYKKINNPMIGEYTPSTYTPTLQRPESVYSLDFLDLFLLEVSYAAKKIENTEEGRKFKYTQEHGYNDIQQSRSFIADKAASEGHVFKGDFENVMLHTGKFKNVFESPYLPKWLKDEAEKERNQRNNILKYLGVNFGYTGTYDQLIKAGIKFCLQDLNKLYNIEACGKSSVVSSDGALLNLLDHCLISIPDKDLSRYNDMFDIMVRGTDTIREEKEKSLQESRSILNSVYQEAMDYSNTTETDYTQKYMELLKRDFFKNADTSNIDNFMKSIDNLTNQKLEGNAKCIYFRKLFTPEYAKSMKYIVDCYEKHGFIPKAVIINPANPAIIQNLTSDEFIMHFKDSRSLEQVKADFRVTLDDACKKSGLSQSEMVAYYESKLEKYYPDGFDMMRFIGYAM